MTREPDYLRPYADAVRAHGASFEATLWLSREKQALRFGVIADAIDLTGRTIVDAGCATGDFAEFLTHRGVRYARYIGLEALPEFVERARARDLANARFDAVDFAADERCFDRLAQADRFDVAVFSGSLNTFEAKRARRIVERAYDAAAAGGGGVVFNFLSVRHGKGHTPDPSPARRFDPVKMLDWALARTPTVLLRQDYMGGHDATVAMVKG